MDKHYLTPLFAPKSIVVFAGNPQAPETQNAFARTITAMLKEDGYAGTVTYLDIGMKGTLADLAHARADLAIIALPHDQIASLSLSPVSLAKVSVGLDGARVSTVTMRAGEVTLSPAGVVYTAVRA